MSHTHSGRGGGGKRLHQLGARRCKDDERERTHLEEVGLFWLVDEVVDDLDARYRALHVHKASGRHSSTR